MVRLQGHVVFDLADGQHGGFGQELREDALVSGVQVLHQHESHPRIDGQVLQ